jgi:citrate lyase alpha subunit
MKLHRESRQRRGRKIIAGLREAIRSSGKPVNVEGITVRHLGRLGDDMMPKILEDLRKKIAVGNPKLPKSSTYAIATSQLQKAGKLPKAKRKR